MTALLKHVATLGPVGYVPWAPGTFGTLVAVLVVAALKPTAPFFAVLLVASTVLGLAASGPAEEALGRKDASHIVIDEFAGYFFAVAFLPLSMGYILASFVLFRVFDILKPPPISALQHLRGGAGVMADDIAAGIFANIILQAWRLLT